MKFFLGFSFLVSKFSNLSNEKSERPERRRAFIAPELKQHNVDITALQETGLPDEGQLTGDGGGYTFFWKGKQLAERRIHWVGFAIKTELVRKLDHLQVGVNERLMTLQLNLCNNQRATLKTAYAPILLADQHEKELFYGHKFLGVTKPWFLETSMPV